MVDSALIVANGILIALVMVALIAVYAARYKKVPPNHAMVLYGRRYGPHPDGGMCVWTGGGKFITPIVESYALLSLEPQDLDLRADRVRQDAKGVSPRDVDVGVRASVKIGSAKGEIEKAARLFLHRGDFLPSGRRDDAQGVRETREAMARAASGILEKHARAIVTMSAVDRTEAEISDAVSAAAETDLLAMGVRVVVLNATLAPSGGPGGSSPSLAANAAADLRRIDARLRRVEEKLGLAPLP